MFKKTEFGNFSLLHHATASFYFIFNGSLHTFQSLFGPRRQFDFKTTHKW